MMTKAITSIGRKGTALKSSVRSGSVSTKCLDDELVSRPGNEHITTFIPRSSTTGIKYYFVFLSLILSRWGISLCDVVIIDVNADISDNAEPTDGWYDDLGVDEHVHDAVRVEKPPPPMAEKSPYACTENRLQEFWQDTPFVGFHIICLQQSALEQEEPYIEMTIYKQGTKDQKARTELPYFLDWGILKNSLIEELDLRHHGEGPDRQPWALYSPEGVRLFSADSQEEIPGQFPVTLIEEYGMVLVYEGGQFLWPPVRQGYKRTIEIYSVMPADSPDLREKGQAVVLETLSVSPLVIAVTGFLTDAECAHIQRRAEPSLRYSGVALMDHDAGRPVSDFRTSQTTFLPAAEDEILKDIDYRTASLVRIPRHHQESTQVLRYGVGERYITHHDFFDPAVYTNSEQTLELIQHGRRNRMATVFWYLTNVQAGGETVFPRFNGNREQNPEDCETGLKVKPEAGKVIIFYSLLADGQLDFSSLHGACPVKEGIKWAANKWVWNEPMLYTPS